MRGLAIVGLAIAALTFVAGLAGCVPAAPPPASADPSQPAGPVPAPAVDPAVALRGMVSALTPADPYRDPTAAERDAVRHALRLLLQPQGGALVANPAFVAAGFVAQHGVDPATGRALSLFVADGATAGWGLLVIDRSTPVRLLVSVPHPGADIDTDQIGLSTFRTIPGTALLVAGAHRQAAGGSADVAHNDSSVFHLVAAAFADRRLPHVQVHGFADQNLPDVQAVVSAGAASVSRLAVAVARSLASDFVVCRAWSAACGQLEGTTNAQARYAEEAGAAFVHIELSWSVRREPEDWPRVAAAIGRALADGPV